MFPARNTGWVLAVLFSATTVQASGEDQVQKLTRSLSRQPITLTADRAEWRSEGLMTYEGHAVFVSGALTLSGDRVEIRQIGPGQYQANVTGNPARLVHAAQDKSPAVSAESKTLFLDSKAGLVQLSGGARLVRGAETLSGDSILYDVPGRRIRAAGGKGRVRMEVPAGVLAPAPQP